MKKIKALRAVRVFTPEEVKENFVRAQYDVGSNDDILLNKYQNELNVAEDSLTETFVAGKNFN